MKPLLLLALASVVLVPGTGCQKSRDAVQRDAMRPAPPVAMVAQKEAEPAPQAPGGGGAPGAVGKPAAAVERKIKYTADIRLICEDLPKAELGLKAAIKAHKGTIAHSEVASAPGSPRAGQWRVRIPVAGFEDFREAVLKLGNAEKNTSDSEDVTDAYYDLENHIKNKLAEEESLRKLLEKVGSEKLEHMLVLRDKLNGVRDYIDREQGKLRLLANLTDLTTVTISLREKEKYAADPPPDVAETPTFGMRVERTFISSWDSFVGFLEWIALVAIAAAPWLGLAAVLSLPIVWLVRRSRRSIPVIGEVVAPRPPRST